MGVSALQRATIAHNKRKETQKAQRRAKVLNAYVNLSLGHKVPWTVDGDQISDGKTVWTLRPEEIKLAKERVKTIQAKREKVEAEKKTAEELDVAQREAGTLRQALLEEMEGATLEDIKQYVSDNLSGRFSDDIVNKVLEALNTQEVSP